MLELILLLFIGILSKVYPTYFLRKKVEEDFTPMYFCRVNLSLSILRCGIGVQFYFFEIHRLILCFRGVGVKKWSKAKRSKMYTSYLVPAVVLH